MPPWPAHWRPESHGKPCFIFSTPIIHDYEIVWTANASSALRLVGDAFPFGPAAPFVLTADNHNSVNGIRQLARAGGAPVIYLPLDDELRVRPFELPRVERGLFAYPAQSNFSGVRHPLDWIDSAQRRGYTVLLDAAAFVPTSPLSLREVRPDFVALSIYKISGYPTGVGALICRHEALRALVRPSFAGGSVEFVSVMSDRHQLKTGSEGFEDGTGNFLAWSGVPPALQMIERLGMPSIHAHVDALTAQVLAGMASVRHANGSPAVWIHGPAEMRDRGGTIAFNLVDDAGRSIDHEHVVDEAAYAGIVCAAAASVTPGLPSTRSATRPANWPPPSMRWPTISRSRRCVSRSITSRSAPFAPRSATRARRATCRRSLPFSRTSPVVRKG